MSKRMWWYVNGFFSGLFNSKFEGTIYGNNKEARAIFMRGWRDGLFFLKRKSK